MLRLSRNTGIAGLSIAAIALLAVGLAVDWPDETGPEQAPDITLSTLTGEKVSLQQLRGRPVLVNFWATSCAQCVHELPRLAELYREAAAQGLEIIAIAMPYDRPDHVLAMSRAKQIPYPVALDINGAATRAFGDVRLTPAFFLIAPDGRIVHRATGPLDKAKLATLLKVISPQASPAIPYPLPVS